MAASPNDKLNTEEYMALENALGNHVLMNGLRKIFSGEAHSKLEALRAEALGQGKPGEMVKYAAESRIYAEWEGTLKRRMEQMAPQRR